MKKFIILLFLCFICQTANAITFTQSNISIEKPVRYIYTGKTFFFGYFVIIETYQPGKYTQLTNDLALWRKSHSLIKDGTPLSIDGNNLVLDSGYVGGWQNNGQYDIVTAPMTNMTLSEQNSAILIINSLPECKVFRTGKNYIDYKCN